MSAKNAFYIDDVMKVHIHASCCSIKIKIYAIMVLDFHKICCFCLEKKIYCEG